MTTAFTQHQLTASTEIQSILLKLRNISTGKLSLTDGINTPHSRVVKEALQELVAFCETNNFPLILSELATDCIAWIDTIKKTQERYAFIRRNGAWSFFRKLVADNNSTFRGTYPPEFLQKYSKEDLTCCKNCMCDSKKTSQDKWLYHIQLRHLIALLELFTGTADDLFIQAFYGILNNHLKTKDCSIYYNQLSLRQIDIVGTLLSAKHFVVVLAYMLVANNDKKENNHA